MASAIIISVVRKQREIGILRAMGAGWCCIMAALLQQGGLAGSVIPTRRAAHMNPAQAIRAWIF